MSEPVNERPAVPDDLAQAYAQAHALADAGQGPAPAVRANVLAAAHRDRGAHRCRARGDGRGARRCRARGDGRRDAGRPARGRRRPRPIAGRQPVVLARARRRGVLRGAAGGRGWLALRRESALRCGHAGGCRLGRRAGDEGRAHAGTTGTRGAAARDKSPAAGGARADRPGRRRCAAGAASRRCRATRARQGSRRRTGRPAVPVRSDAKPRGRRRARRPRRRRRCLSPWWSRPSHRRRSRRRSRCPAGARAGSGTSPN